MVARAIGFTVLAVLSGAVDATNGTNLLLHCQEAEQFSESKPLGNAFAIGVCAGMVEGVAGAMESLNLSLPPELRTCFPEERLSATQSSRIVLKYLRENPERLHEAGPFLTMLAFNKAYPCRR